MLRPYATDCAYTAQLGLAQMRQIAGSFAQYEKTRLVMKLRGARERDPDLVIAAKRLH